MLTLLLDQATQVEIDIDSTPISYTHLGQKDEFSHTLIGKNTSSSLLYQNGVMRAPMHVQEAMRPPSN